MRKGLYEKFRKGAIRCLACANKCVLLEGKTGICRVRKNDGGELNLLVDGKVVAEHVDPIEKKPLYHFLPGTKVYSISCVGCNFRCAWCQNFDISQATEIIGKSRTPSEIVEAALRHGCESIAYTYTEPTIWAEFVYEVSKLAKKNSLKNVWVTNGYFSKECLKLFAKEKLIDAMNIDLKSFREEVYRKYCGARLAPVLDSMKRVVEQKIHLEITTLLIPGINDSEKELKEIARFIFSLDGKGEVPWHISRFFPMYKMLDRPITPLKTLKKAEEIGRKVGLKYIYIGNV